MSRNFNEWLIAVFIFAVAGCASKPPTPVDLAITNITVIDPETRTLAADQSVFIDEGRILAIEDSGIGAFAPQEAIDGTGKFIIPGLMNMHAHTAVAPVVENTLKLMIANGVTGIRDMSADCWEPRGEVFLCIEDMRKYRKEIEAGERPGPRLLKLASPIVQSASTWQLPENPDPAYSPITAEQGTYLVGYLAERGVDLIKVYDRFHPDAYRAILAEAARIDMEVSGHIPIFISTMEASDLGQRTIEHARDLLTDCSAYGETYRSGNNAMIEGDTSAGWPKQDDLRVQSVTTFDPDICAALMATMVKNSTYYVPTHGTREMDVRAREQAYRNDPRLTYMGEFVRKDWLKDLDQTATIPEEKLSAYQAYYSHGLKLTKLAIEAGVGVMIGTDANDTMMFPGFGVHDEMVRFAEAGVEPMDILRAATTTSAAYIGRSDEFGGVSEGKLADLVILRDNPLEDISNTTSIDTVIFNGRIYTRDALDKLLNDVRKDAE